MSPPTGTELDMDYDPAEDGDDEDEDPLTGALMIVVGAVVFFVFLLWDAFGAGVPAMGSYSILGLWLVLAAGVRVAEGISR